MDQLTNMYRNVEVQIGQIANAINNRSQGELPSKTEVNPREHVKAITLRSGKQLSEPQVVKEEKEKESEKKEEEMSEEVVKSEGNKNKGKEIVSEPLYSETISIPPLVLFLDRLKQSRIDKEFEKFVKIFKHLHINIPFVDIIFQIPSYA